MEKILKNYSDDELCSLIQQKKKVGFDYLYSKHCGLLYGVALNAVKSQSYAEEIIHKTFEKVWNNINNYKPQSATLNIWILSVLFCTIKEYLAEKNISFKVNCDKFPIFSIQMLEERVC
ncbi:hypothetical protein ASG01_11295 [Chryseobacterium sp. Leaf180]|jgi:DNA-directed RNA polymerase specialized sigma24 family protein|uniref:RNA polymerase sigma factor n=1 Tax=Chryseobacterium sp. Leaf180 TaxID=1736289 RepID=UPI0006FD025D|nr:sigma factor [Chryseobacterium sp. Leaf180]KQR92496.1 hypothetical protein ASG01_11295 [Chryseobacterium sp. Leaf180]